MGKFKIVVVILLTSSVLIAGAFIPKLISDYSDWKTVGRDGQYPMHAIELNMYQELSAIGKLAMMSRIDSLIPISESKAGMNREEVMNAAVEGLTPYISAQLATLYEENVEMQPYLIHVADYPELQRVIWQVTVSGGNADNSVFHLFVDDETGKILQINFTSEDFQNPYSVDETLPLFADIYFSGLGIENHWDFLMEDREYAYDDVGGYAVQFRLLDQQYGEIFIDMFVYEHGFYVEFPEAA